MPPVLPLVHELLSIAAPHV